MKEALADAVDIDSAIIAAMRSIGASLVICTLTTAAGFYAFVPSRLFEGVSELGMIAGTGMFVSFAVSVTVLPALLSIVYRGRHRGSDVRVATHLTSFAMRRARLVVAVTFALVVLAALSLPFVYFDSNPVNLRDPNAESVVALGDLARDSDADMLTMVALFDDGAAMGAWEERFAELAEVRETRSIDSLVPEDQSEKLFVLEDLAFVMGPGFSALDYESAGEGSLITAATRLHDALERSQARSPAEQRLREALALFLERQRDGGAGIDIAGLDRALLGNLPDQLGRLEQALLAESFSSDDLPVELRVLVVRLVAHRANPSSTSCRRIRRSPNCVVALR